MVKAGESKGLELVGFIHHVGLNRESHVQERTLANRGNVVLVYNKAQELFALGIGPLQLAVSLKRPWTLGMLTLAAANSARVRTNHDCPTFPLRLGVFLDH